MSPRSKLYSYSYLILYFDEEQQGGNTKAKKKKKISETDYKTSTFAEKELPLKFTSTRKYLLGKNMQQLGGELFRSNV